MKATDLISLLGGLSLFLYGMQMMSNGLEAAAGNKMKRILERLTANRILGVLVGAGITAVIQSSSATTVMVVGFVNSGMMTLQQAVWIIMGANIGTTITGQLIALDIGAIAPLFAFIGVAMIVFLNKEKLHHFGKIIAGLGILFIGMDMMSAAMMPLRESEAFVALMTQLLQSGSGHPGRRNLHRDHPVFLRLGGYPAGAGHPAALSALPQRGLCPVRPEHRYLHHGSAGGHRHQPQRQAHHHHPPFL